MNKKIIDNISEPGMGVAVRECLPGQHGEDLYPIRCAGKTCAAKYPGKRSQLLGRFPRGTFGEIKCSRCGTVNTFVIEGD